jgi:hypothetical protein
MAERFLGVDDDQCGVGARHLAIPHWKLPPHPSAKTLG